MRVLVLMENSTPSSRLVARHGLSLWLELSDGRRVLFDMGPDDAFLANARQLGVDVTTAHLAVLSHGHYDHGGGLSAFLRLCEDAGRQVPVFVRERAFEAHASGTGEHHHFIGLDAALARCARWPPGSLSSVHRSVTIPSQNQMRTCSWWVRMVILLPMTLLTSRASW